MSFTYITLLHLDLEGNLISSNVVTDLEKQYMEGDHYLVLTRTPEYIQGLLKKRSVNNLEVSSSSDGGQTMEKMGKEVTNQFPPFVSDVPNTQINTTLTPQRQMTQSPREELGKVKAKQLLSMSEFVGFFRTAEPQQLKIFFDVIKEDCEEFHKKQKTSHPTPGESR